ncbi:MAG TPA: hypothetical protein VFE46_12075 [Pirellulales bacterium]|nr:hypothetical protein [Pirellulales bacterium]
MPRKSLFRLIVVAGWLLSAAAAWADGAKGTDTSEAKKNLKVETVLGGLNHPCSVAVRPETEYVYIADCGAGQVLRFSPAHAEKAAPAVIDFPIASPAAANAASGGLWGLAFLSRNALATVSSTIQDDHEEAAISAFELPTVGSAAEEKPLSYTAGNRKSIAIFTGANAHSGEINGFSVALFDFSSSALLIAARRGDDKAGIYKADLGKNHDSIDSVHGLFKSGAANKSPTIICATVSPHGLLVAVQTPADDAHSGASLAFYQLRNGSLLTSMPLALTDVVALAYSPEHGRLYAITRSAGKSDDDGLYRLDAGKVDDRAGVKAVKMTALEQPSAMTFGTDSTLWATALGPAGDSAKNDSSAKSGKLLKITGDL